MPRQLRVPQSWFRLPSALRARGGAAQVGAIGFELGREHVRMLQLERRGEAIGLRAMASVPNEDGDPAERADWLKAVVTSALRSQPFRGRRVVTVLPRSGAKLMVLNYELSEASDEAQIIVGLVQERVEESIEECVVDYQPIRLGPERTGPCSALVAVARQVDVIEYLELLRSAGLEVDAVEIAPVAIQRLVGWLSRDDLSSHSLVLHCGQRRTHLVGLAGRRLVLYREVEFGKAPLVETLSKALDMSEREAAAVLQRYGVWPDDSGTQAWDDPAAALEIAETVREILKPAAYALASEIERAGVYTASQWRGATLDHIGVLGAFASWPGIDRLIESLVSIPTHVLDPVASISAARPGIPKDDTALCTGLALRELVEHE